MVSSDHIFYQTWYLYYFPGSRNYDYEAKYQRDKQGDEATENARVWNVYLDEAESYDMDMVQGFRNNIDGLLVFAALFSAVVTTFVAQTSQSLQPDNGKILVSLFYETNQLLRAAGNRTSVDAVPKAALVPGSRTHSSTDIWVNGLFFTSLTLSLSTALLTVLAKQWIQVCTLFPIIATTLNRNGQAYSVVVSGSARTRALIRHFRFKGLIKYKLSEVIESLPLILHSSVAIFFIGLALYISQLSPPICGAVSVITALTFVFYFGTSMLPAFDITCPYRISFIFSLANYLVFAFHVARHAYFSLRCSDTWMRYSKTWPDISALMFPLAKPLVSAFRMAGHPYFKIRDYFFSWMRNYKMWPEGSLEKAEHKQVFPSHDDEPWGTVAASHACESIDWVFNHSSNRSVKNIVVEVVCAMLEEWNSKADLFRYFLNIVSSPEHSNLFLSVTTYSLSQLPNLPAQSTTEQDLEQSTCSRLIGNLMKISASRSLFDEGISELESWQEEIEPVWMTAYRDGVRSRNHTLSRHLLDWGQPLSVQSERNLDVLFACAQCGDEEDIRDLVDRGMNLNLQRSRGWTALHEAARYGNLDAVIALSQREPGLMSQAIVYVSQEPRTALVVAIEHCKPDVVAYLLDHGAQAPPNAIHTAMRLEWFQADERLATVQLLLDRGWDRTAEDTNGKTPIDVAHDWPDFHPDKPAIIKYLKDYPNVRHSPSEPTVSPTSNEEEK
ncbi:hypothetical protein C0993_002143 [Termitomyces sp. T159_Od127]|nr:hypothetical protein C0993_002143 [Termitomyces sp. T159_Od127]